MAVAGAFFTGHAIADLPVARGSAGAAVIGVFIEVCADLSAARSTGFFARFAADPLDANGAVLGTDLSALTAVFGIRQDIHTSIDRGRAVRFVAHALASVGIAHLIGAAFGGARATVGRIGLEVHAPAITAVLAWIAFIVAYPTVGGIALLVGTFRSALSVSGAGRAYAVEADLAGSAGIVARATMVFVGFFVNTDATAIFGP